MSNTQNDFSDHSDSPTEELYIELRDLENIESATPTTDESGTPSVGDGEDPSGIRERIAYLRALLTDRGVIED
jgi:hypothetical protein